MVYTSGDGTRKHHAVTINPDLFEFMNECCYVNKNLSLVLYLIKKYIDSKRKDQILYDKVIVRSLQLAPLFRLTQEDEKEYMKRISMFMCAPDHILQCDFLKSLVERNRCVGQLDMSSLWSKLFEVKVYPGRPEVSQALLNSPNIKQGAGDISQDMLLKEWQKISQYDTSN